MTGYSTKYVLQKVIIDYDMINKLSERKIKAEIIDLTYCGKD